MAEHSELPWVVVPPEMDDGEAINGAGLLDARGQSVFTVDCGDCNMLDEATARLIMRACNSHHELLAACKLAFVNINDTVAGVLPARFTRVAEFLMAAIANTEGR